LFAQLVFKISNLWGHDPPTSQTDRQTDGQTTYDSKTALCTIVHRAVKSQRKTAQQHVPGLGLFPVTSHLTTRQQAAETRGLE